jgi:hypothetical protein
MALTNYVFRVAMAASFAAGMTACGGGGAGPTPAGSLAQTGAADTQASPNSAPVISGIPTFKVVKGETYSFVPDASDVDADVLTFSITSPPGWATFSTATGELSGSPSGQDVGMYENITITVSDGEDSASLGPFVIQVLQVGPRSAELGWIPPTENSDGSPLTDLSGYVVYWGTTKGNHSSSVTLENPGLTTYVVENLAPGQTYYFVVTAYNEAGLESDDSNEASKTIAADE